MNTEKELKERMEEAIFTHTTCRKENEKIAGICADIAVRFFSSNAVLAVTSDSTKNKKESEVAFPTRCVNEKFVNVGFSCTGKNLCELCRQ